MAKFKFDLMLHETLTKELARLVLDKVDFGSQSQVVTASVTLQQESIKLVCTLLGQEHPEAARLTKKIIDVIAALGEKTAEEKKERLH